MELPVKSNSGDVYYLEEKLIYVNGVPTYVVE